MTCMTDPFRRDFNLKSSLLYQFSSFRDWVCAYSTHRTELLLLNFAVDINCEVIYRNTLRFPQAAPEHSTYRTYQWNILEAFLAQNIYLYVNPHSLDELKLLISTAGGRFPRAWLEPRANRMLVMDAVLRIMNKLKRLWN